MQKLKRLTEECFQSLTQYQYASAPWTREKEWWADVDERAIGSVVPDLTDKDGPSSCSAEMKWARFDVSI
jgi:hypothetical protein